MRRAYSGQRLRGDHAGDTGSARPVRSRRRGASAARPQGRGPLTMCGIVGYVGRREATPILLEGLARLEYRGYDSAGVAGAKGGGNLAPEPPGPDSPPPRLLAPHPAPGAGGVAPPPLAAPR